MKRFLIVALSLLAFASSADVKVLAGDDCRVSYDNMSVNLDGTGLWIGGNRAYDDVSYIKFGLSSLPAGSEIHAVTLSLYCYDNDARAFRIRECEESWTESSISWAGQPFGGDTSLTINNYTVNGWWEIRDTKWTSPPMSSGALKLTQLVQDWVDGTRENHGLMLDAAVLGKYVRFRDGEYSNGDYRPKLTIEYTDTSPSSDDVYEENDLMPYAENITWKTNTWLNGLIQSDDDWYRIEVVSGSEKIHVKCDFVDSEGDINMALYYSSGTLAAESITTTDNEELIFNAYPQPPNSSSPLYIKVSGDKAGNEYSLWWDGEVLPGPEVGVNFAEEGFGDIQNGDSTPSTVDGTDFGTTTVGTPVEKTFSVGNSGDETLTTSGLSWPSGFTLVESLSSSISSDSSDRFTIKCDATLAGTYEGNIQFNNNDADENPFNFKIKLVVESAPVVLTGILISGSTNVNEGATAQYACTAYYSDGSSQTVTPTWSENSSYTSINSSGLLAASSVSSDQAVTITASYGGKADSHAVMVKNISQTGALSVTISPAGAVSARAQWQVDGGVWQNSGATVSSLSAGGHAVSFKTVSGYSTPGGKSVTVASGQTATTSGSYTATGSNVTTNTYDLSSLCEIWDVSGTYNDDVLGISFTVAQDGKGKIVGGGSWSAVEEGISINATVAIKGSLKSGKDGATSLKLQMKHTGTASLSGQTSKFSASQKVTAVIDSRNLELRGQIETSLSMAGQKVKQMDAFNEDLPSGMDGSMVLTIKTRQDSKGAAYGSGSCELSNSETLSLVVKGKLNKKTGAVKLSLSGQKGTAGSGSKISMEVSSDLQDIESMKGKVLGQAILVD